MSKIVTRRMPQQRIVPEEESASGNWRGKLARKIGEEDQHRRRRRVHRRALAHCPARSPRITQLPAQHRPAGMPASAPCGGCRFRDGRIAVSGRNRAARLPWQPVAIGRRICTSIVDLDVPGSAKRKARRGVDERCEGGEFGGTSGGLVVSWRRRRRRMGARRGSDPPEAGGRHAVFFSDLTMRQLSCSGDAGSSALTNPDFSTRNWHPGTGCSL